MQINLIITWSAHCFIVAGAVANQVPTFTITNTEHYASVVTFLTQNNAKTITTIKIRF